MLLAIDTSTTQTGLALYHEQGVIAECTWQSGRNHTAQVLPQLDMLLRHTNLRRDSLRAIAVASGPGSWSGLRVGMSIAKALVLAANLPLLGVGTLDVLAYAHAPSPLPVLPLIRLGRDRFATAQFAAGDPPERGEADRNTTLEQLAAAIDQPTLFCGDLDAAVRNELSARLGDRARFPRLAANHRRAACLAEIAWQRWQRGETDDPVALEPIYLGEAVQTRSEPNRA